MADTIKNPFDFGTGSIDKDQWLRDIDSKLEEFISMYGSAANKHRTALLRQAFQDLRRRIASGDMLNRTADGLYQFGSALNREDKHMLEAYQRALGFMGKLARTQIKAPTPLEEKKYGTSTLLENWLKYLNPSGKFNEKAYWAEGDDASRIADIKKFLEKEKNGLGAYSGFDGYKDRADLEWRIQAFLDSPTERNLQRLGFDSRNWITKPVEEAPAEAPKTELEQVQEQLAAQLETEKVRQGRQYLSFGNNRGTQEYNFTTPSYDFNAALNNYLSLGQKQTKVADSFNPGFAERSRRQAAQDYVSAQQQELDNYFSSFATGWKGIYDIGEENRNRMANYLSRLFSTYNKGTNQDGTPLTDYAFNWKKYFTLIGDNQYLINGSLDKSTGRYQYYVPGEGTAGGGIFETNVLDSLNPYIAQQLGIQSQKQGGKIELMQNGGGFNYDAWTAGSTPKTSVPLPKKEAPKESPNDGLDTGDWITIIGTTAADIGSMLSANAVGYGTVASAGLGVASTLGNTINDFRHGNVGGGLANLGIGLGTDLIGLVPGFGAGAKGYKIGRTLTRFARPLMAAFAANNYKEAGVVLNKGLKNGFGSLSAEDWSLLATTLTSMASRGKSAHTRQNNVEFMHKATLASSPKDSKGNIAKHVINELGFIDARKELLKQKRFGFNTSSTKYTDKVWKSIPEGGEVNAPYYVKPFEFKLNFNKGKKNKQVERYEDYLKRSKETPATEVEPSASGSMVTVEAPTTTKPKRKPLTEEQKQARALKRALKKLEAETKLRELREQQAKASQFAMQEEIPMPGSLAIARTRQEELQALRSPWASMQEIPAQKPINSQVESFNKRYGKAVKRHRIGGILIALRNGGIVKAKAGVKLSLNAGTWYNDIFSNYKDIIASNLNNATSADDLTLKVKWLNGMQQLHADIYKNAGKNFQNEAYGSEAVKAYQMAYADGNGMVQLGGGFNTAGIQPNYNKRYDFGGTERNTGDNPVGFTNDGWFSSITDDRRLLGRVGDWDETLLAAFNNLLKQSGYRMVLNNAKYGDDYYRLEPLTTELDTTPTNPNDLVLQDAAEGKIEVSQGIGSGDSETERDTISQVSLKNPIDPTPFVIAGKTIQGLIGNADIYGNLLKEMPQAPLRDPIARQLAIVGWQERIKQGQNQLADLRRIQQRQQGADQQTNFATALETERTGRDIMDKALAEDSGRLFETAQKLWNLKNEDVLYNTKVGDDNRIAIADRQRMMAQIRAAWRSGNNNIKMGALADTGYWLLKKYQLEQDLINDAKKHQLGSVELFTESYMSELHPDYEALKDEFMNEKTTRKRKNEIANTILKYKLEAMKKAPSIYAQRYYNMYHQPFFGGGFKTTILKSGGSLEKEKLKARGKDNDRYVSMIKDLRKSSSRRRRRRFYYED